MASFTIEWGRDMDRILTRGFAAVMAIGTVGCSRETAVIHIVGGNPSGGLVAAIARSLS